MLNLDVNVEQPDEMYQVIIDMHEGLTDEQSGAANAKLILLLANHIGDLEVVRQAVNIARKSR